MFCIDDMQRHKPLILAFYSDIISIKVWRNCAKRSFAVIIKCVSFANAFLMGRQRYLQVLVIARSCRFKSRHPYHIGTQVLIRYLRSFSFTQKPRGTRGFDTFANEINFIVLELTTRKSKLSDSNLCIFAPNQITMTLYSKNKCHRQKRKVSLSFLLDR